MQKPYIICHMMMSIDGRPSGRHPVNLQLKNVQSYQDDGTIWLRYLVK